MADIFGRNSPALKVPITADKCSISWGGLLTGAVNLHLAWNRSLTRRRKLGNRSSVIISGIPYGTLSIGFLLTTDSADLFSRPGWDMCSPGSAYINLAGCSGGGGGLNLSGLIVTGYELQMEAEGVSVVANVTAEFSELSV